MDAASVSALRLHAWRATERARLAAAAGAVACDWAVGWGLDPQADPPPACRDATPGDREDGRAWSAWRTRGGACLWWCPRPDIQAWLCERLFGATPRAGSLAAVVPGAALDNLRERLLAWAGAMAQPEGPAPRPAELGPWSGALHLQLPAGVLLLSGDWMAAWMEGPRAGSDACTKRPPLHRVGQALADQQLRLQARLDGARVPVGALAAWRPGQVVPLRHRVDQPVALTDAGGRVWQHAWLVDLEGRRAVELARGPDVRTNAEETP